VAAATQTARFRGFAGIRGYYRRPWGDGWALVGDAGYFRDPITTHGITDAFRDAELLARAVSGQSSLPEYERTRDRVSRDLFEVTDRIASYRWTQDELRRDLREVSKAMKAEVDLILSLDAPVAA
jgi:flavin-dependent dehydrogenase